jgi:tetratricopeptide (TPR) repeat protein
MGAVCSALGRNEQAIAHFTSVAKAQPQSATTFLNLGRAQRAAKKYADAITSFEEAIRLQGSSPVLLVDLGTALDGLGDKGAAVKVYRDCVAQFPSHMAAYSPLAQTLMALGEDAAAEGIIKSWLARAANDPEAHLILGVLYYRMARHQEAESCLRKVIAARPNEALPQAYLSAVLLAEGRLAEAESFARLAYARDSANAEILTNYGLILQARGLLQQSRDLHQSAVDANPLLPEAWNNLGVTLQQLGCHNEAFECYQKALQLKPQFHGALANRAQLHLLLGQLGPGWQTYGSRFFQKLLASKARIFPYPSWDGVPSASTRLLLWTDQGLGDEVLYASILPDLEKHVQECMLECAPRMVTLFQRSFPWVRVVPRIKPNGHSSIAEFMPSHQAPLIDLGQYYRPSISAISAHSGYLKPDEGLVSQLRKKYDALARGRRVVGLSWKSENPHTGGFKSIPLADLKSILSQDGALFVSLQYGDTQEELANVATSLGVNVFCDDGVDARENPERSAGQIAAMDLVITTSNTTAHFAGAMNVPVWTMVPTGPGALWYWFLSRSDSPWYPSMTLFRQPQPGDWGVVITEISNQFQKWLAS